MKKKLFSFLFFFLPLYVQANGCFLYVTQDEYIDFNIYDPSIGHGPQHKQPVEMPSVSLDDHTFFRHRPPFDPRPVASVYAHALIFPPLRYGSCDVC